jgi:hypothetical protein
MLFSDCAIIRINMAPRAIRFLSISLVLLAGSVLVVIAAEKRQQRPVTSAYFAGKEVQIQPVIEPGSRSFSYGPWIFGSIVHDDKASDHRFNLYLIAPGSQHQSPTQADEFNHSVLINSAEDEGDKTQEWDVFWVIVLDPELNQEIRDERELLLLGQAYFLPRDLYGVEDAPGHTLLRQLGMASLSDLAKFRRADGALPRAILLSAGAAVKMKVTPPPPAE